MDIERYRENALKILAPIKSVDKDSKADESLLFSAKRSIAGRKINDYYLVYFLFVNLLDFKNMGKFEKSAWCIPIDYEGKVFLIEHRKMGVGIFIQNEDDEDQAKIITKKINGAIACARPYFKYLAEESIKSSDINIVNNNQNLFERFNYFLDLFKQENNKTVKLSDESIWQDGHLIFASKDYHKVRQAAKWLAISTIESFFSWTEHLFIHLAIITQKVKTGEEVTKLIDAEWKEKFNIVISGKDLRKFYDDLILIRNQVRNFVAHGAFGKDGHAFQFHSGAGAVPVKMHFDRKKNRFSFEGTLEFNDSEVIKLIELFISAVNSSSLKPALTYTQERGLITILPFASNGEYEYAMYNDETMEKFCDYLQEMFDNSINMDW